ncbi:MAG: helix-turn-helix transcriptional regulator, partial [Rubrivivax sp.]|nr:helix-turn-helix transcriptional regulator [Rubrivivax sp.]
MLDMTSDTPAPAAPGAAPEVAPLGTLLARALDEVDFGIALVAEDGEVLHMNHRARHALYAEQGLQVLGKRLRTSDPCSLISLHDALRDAARRGLRRLLPLGHGDATQLAALVPVQPGVAALLLGRTSVCEELSMQCFARTHALTAAETRVLAALGRGVTPAEIARELGVKISTVRTQINAIRQKTDTATITALVHLVAGLPPMV